MIRFDHVSKRFDDGTVAVDNFNLRVESHHLVVLLGSSGCGKTTLLRMVNRMVDPSEGRILIDDTDVATVNPVSYTHLRAHETGRNLVCRLLLEKKK